jgi:hypothetical protein
VQILEALRNPDSAAGVARRIGAARQKVNYHLKELERVKLVQPTGERRSGNFIETLYQAVARSFVVSPSVAWADPRRFEALKAQHSLKTLVVLGERLQADAAALLDRAAFDGEEIASASVDAEAFFASEADRAAFLEHYVLAVQQLLERYATRDGEGYRIVVAAYPQTERRDQ